MSELAAEVDDLRRQLRRAQRLATVGTMAAMVAHEFNNILTPVLNYAQMARRGNDAVREKAIRMAHEGSLQATAICQALLDLTGRGGEKPRKVALATLVAETLTAMARDPSKDSIRMITRVSPAVELWTRPAELKQVLLNLIMNARQAVLRKPRGQSISISALRRSDEVFIRVSDTGVGIPRDDLKRVFEPFFTTQGSSGSGLGLAVCRHIVESLNGRMAVRSQVDKGTCFTVVLPLVPKAGRRPRKVVKH
ncbi:MAG: sensor histidine kinase [Planctomycetota bacterium]